MKSRKLSFLLTIVCFITISVIEIAHGGWPDPPWRDLPKLEYIYDSGDSIWFYSGLEVGGFPPRYVVTYEKSTKSIRFHPISSKTIPEDAPIDFHRSKQLPPYLSMEPHEITLKGNKIAIPELTSEEIKCLSKWSVYLQRNSHLPLSELSLSNALQGSFIEISGVYYFGMKGGISEGSGYMGGLLVYYPSEKSVVLRSKYLVDCSVTGIMQIGDELAISTIYRGEAKIAPGSYWEDGKPNEVALVLYNMNTGEWRHPSTESSDIIIREMSVIDGSVWMITNWGISCYNPKTDRIQNWYWSLSLVEKLGGS